MTPVRRATLCGMILGATLSSLSAVDDETSETAIDHCSPDKKFCLRTVRVSENDVAEISLVEMPGVPRGA